MPYAKDMLLCAVCTALQNRISFFSYCLALREKPLRLILINASGTQRTSTSRLPWFAVLWIRCVTQHARNLIAIVLAVPHDR